MHLKQQEIYQETHDEVNSVACALSAGIISVSMYVMRGIGLVALAPLRCGHVGVYHIYTRLFASVLLFVSQFV